MFDTAVHNPYRFPPRWLNEGLAVYLSEGYGSQDRGRVESAASADELIPLIAAGRRSSRPTPSARSSPTPSRCRRSTTSCARWARTPWSSSSTAYADGLTDDEAFQRALGEDLAAFQAGWLADLGAAEPQRYGPEPAPAGPLPSELGRSAAGAGCGRLARRVRRGGRAADPRADVVAGGGPRGERGLVDRGPGRLLVVALVVLGVVAVLAIVRRRRRASPA